METQIKKKLHVSSTSYEYLLLYKSVLTKKCSLLSCIQYQYVFAGTLSSFMPICSMISISKVFKAGSKVIAVTSGAFVSLSDSGNINIDQIKQTVSHFNTACHITCVTEFLTDPGRNKESTTYAHMTLFHQNNQCHFFFCLCLRQHTHKEIELYIHVTMQHNRFLIK